MVGSSKVAVAFSKAGAVSTSCPLHLHSQQDLSLNRYGMVVRLHTLPSSTTSSAFVSHSLSGQVETWHALVFSRIVLRLAHVSADVYRLHQSSSSKCNMLVKMRAAARRLDILPGCLHSHHPASSPLDYSFQRVILPFHRLPCHLAESQGKPSTPKVSRVSQSLHLRSLRCRSSL